MEGKLCPKCKQVKSIAEFAKDHQTKSGLRSHCKECCHKYQINYYQRTRQERIRSTKNWRKDNRSRALDCMKKRRIEIKLQLIQGYGGKCSCCGETEVAFLTLEHLNGGGREHRRGTGSLSVYREIIKNNFPHEYTVLCMNCNFAKRFGKKCPHEAKREKIPMSMIENKSITDGLVGALEKIASLAKHEPDYDLNFCALCGEEWGYGHKDGCPVGIAQDALTQAALARAKGE